MRSFYIQLGVLSTLVLTSLILVIVFVSPPAKAHTTYCGHGTRTFDGGYKYEQWNYGWGEGPHWHEYRTYKWILVGSHQNGYWQYIHTHTRQCASHAT